MSDDFRIREFKPTDSDYEQIVGIYNSLFTSNQRNEFEYGSVNEMKASDGKFEGTEYTMKRYVAEETDSGRVVGYAHYFHMPWAFNPNKYKFAIRVLPDCRRKGVGTKFFKMVMKDMEEKKAEAVRSIIYTTMPAGIEFMEKIGWPELYRRYIFNINPQRFNFTPYEIYLSNVKAQGIQITTAAEEQKTDPDCLQKLYDLHIALKGDTSMGDDYTPTSIESFEKSVNSNPRSIPEAFFIAKHNNQYIGESFIHRSKKSPGAMVQLFTGVIPEYRSRGIGIALKLKGIEYAKSREVTLLKSWVESRNETMLAMTHKLGYACDQTAICFEKDLK